MIVVAEAQDGDEAVALALQHKPDVVLMDISMPGMNGIEATRRIKEGCPRTQVIALSMHLDMRMVLEMVLAGARAYLLKECAFDEAIHAIDATASGSAYFSAKVVDSLVQDYAHNVDLKELPSLFGLSTQQKNILSLLVDGRHEDAIAAALDIRKKDIRRLCHELICDHIAAYLYEMNYEKTECAAALTCREKEILLLISKGKNNKDVADNLGVSRDTIKFHMKNVMQKLNANNRSQAVTIALNNRLLEL